MKAGSPQPGPATAKTDAGSRDLPRCKFLPGLVGHSPVVPATQGRRWAV